MVAALNVAMLQEVVMRDLRADWRKWTGSERISAALLTLAMSGVVPMLLLLGNG
jgi:hypothetical protein